MQALTLEVIMRVVFGSRDERLRAALRAALDLTTSLPRLIAMALTPARLAAVAALRAGRRARSTRSCSRRSARAGRAPGRPRWSTS